MPPTIDAIVAGHICLDVIPDLSRGSGADFQRLFSPGRLVEVGKVSFSSGGPVANTGLALRRLGIHAQLMGKIGDDLYGEEIRSLVAEADPELAQGMVVDPGASTSYTVVINPPQVDRIFLHFPGANEAFGPDDVRYDLAAQSRLFHFGYPPIMRSMYANGGAGLTELFRRVRATGTTTSLDMSLPDPTSDSGRADWAGILTRTLPFVDIFQPSAEEILYMLRRDLHARLSAAGDVLDQVTAAMLTDLSAEILALGSRIVVIKLGHRGLYLRTAAADVLVEMGPACPSDLNAWAEREIWAPAFRVDEVGATGSGDAAIAGFLAALLRDLTPEEAVTAATAVGACNVEAADALSGIRTWDETQARIRSGWPKHELQIETLGWRFDAGNRLWLGPA